MLRLAGAERSADRRATFLFHPVSHTMQAQAQGYLGRSIERHRRLFELTLHSLYKERTRLSAQTIARFGREELVFDGAAALKVGSIHRIEILDVKA
jgi:ATP-dependent protease ClpP protease subunit